MPDWLGQLPDAPDTDSLQVPADMVDTSEPDLELTMPEGLAGPLEDKEAPVPSDVEEEAPPARVAKTRQKTGITGLLTNLREQTQEPTPSSEPAEVASEAEIPEWLANASPEEVAQLLAELESLSDEEAQRLLDEALQQEDD